MLMEEAVKSLIRNFLRNYCSWVIDEPCIIEIFFLVIIQSGFHFDLNLRFWVQHFNHVSGTNKI